jgi:hypothetical protein
VLLLVTKKKITYSINVKVLDLFDKYCEENAINKSKYVENLIKNDIRKKTLKGD